MYACHPISSCMCMYVCVLHSTQPKPIFQSAEDEEQEDSVWKTSVHCAHVCCVVCVHMCVCAHVCVCTCVCVHMCVCAYVCVSSIYMYIPFPLFHNSK